MYFDSYTLLHARISLILMKPLPDDTKAVLSGLKMELEKAHNLVICGSRQQAINSDMLESLAEEIGQTISPFNFCLDQLHLDEAVKGRDLIIFYKKIKACCSNTTKPLDYCRLLIVDLKVERESAENNKQATTGYQLIRWMRSRHPIQTQPSNLENVQFISGLEDDVNSLVTKLIGEDADQHTTVFAIAGMVGSGKTTIARKLYNDQQIKGHFGKRRAWVSVSQVRDTLHLQRSLCKSFGIATPDDKTKVPLDKLREFIKKGSYLVILDDVWDMSALQVLHPQLFPEGGAEPCGRVLVTTQNEGIFQYPEARGRVYVHRARALTQEESWKLFSEIVNQKWQGIKSLDDDAEFTELAKDMLQRCHGLPVAVVALARILRSASLRECDRVSSEILKQHKVLDDYGEVGHMLERSYIHLPYHLKPCFLYLSIFPKDECIYVDELTQLWVAEGFLMTTPYDEDKTLDELGAEFVDELVQRSMVKVVRRDYEEKIEAIRVHDLIREFCIDKAKESRFFKIGPPFNGRLPYRAIIHNCRDSKEMHDNPRLLSCICLKGYIAIVKEMKFLRVLHLQNVKLDNSFEQIGSMFFLRYLKIEKCSGFKKLPSNIGELTNLLVFIFDGDLDPEHGVPANMVVKMENLRHFSLALKANLEPDIGLSRLKDLHTVSVSAGTWLAKEEMFNSVHLRVLKLDGINSQDELNKAYDLVRNVENRLNELSLTLKHGSGLEYDLKELRLKMQSVNLYLQGKIRRQQLHSFFFPCIYKLELDHTQIVDKEDFKIALAQLRELRYLLLKWDSYLADTLTLAGLPQLQMLYIGNLSNLKEWRIEEGGLPNLKKLEIFDCYQLERLPTEISSIHTLQSFVATYISGSFYKRLQQPLENEDSGKSGGRGEDFHLIERILSKLISTSYN